MEAFVPIATVEEQQAGVETPRPEINILGGADTYGKFVVEPLERGFGITLGNPLRRVLLSAIPGSAITWVYIQGVLHEYGSIPHVKEEVLGLLQRIKAIRLRSLTDRPGRMYLEVTGPGEVYAGDIAAPADFEIVNPELHLATLDSAEGKLEAEFNVELGHGYVPAQHGDGLPIGTLPVDAIFTPVRRVNYSVERTRVGQVTDYERLVLEVWTDGSITPKDAMQKAAQTLIDHLFLFTVVGKGVLGPGTAPSITLSIPTEIYNTPVERLDLSSRTLNCLKRATINKIGEVLERSRADLLKIRNFGERSLEELLTRLQEKELPIPEALSGEAAVVQDEAETPDSIGDSPSGPEEAGDPQTIEIPEDR